MIRVKKGGRGQVWTKVPRVFSLSLSLLLKFEIGQKYWRRETRTRRRFACFASWLRQFVSAAAAVAVAARLGPPGPYTFGPPSAGSSALSSVDRAFPRTSPRRFPRARLLPAGILPRTPLPPLSIPPSLSFIFVFAPSICTYERRYLVIPRYDSIFGAARPILRFVCNDRSRALRLYDVVPSLSLTIGVNIIFTLGDFSAVDTHRESIKIAEVR